MGAALEDMDAQIQRLQAKAKNAGAEARQRYAPQIAELKKHAKEVRKQLSEADTVAADQWDNVKKGTATAMDKLGNGLDKAADWLRNK
jgi:phage host-nuclease inhibitor protein Gam